MSVVRALIAAHERDVVHRDLEPENIMMEKAVLMDRSGLAHSHGAFCQGQIDKLELLHQASRSARRAAMRAFEPRRGN